MSRDGVALFWFVILTLIIFLLLVWFKPDFVLRERDCERTDEVDYFVALIAAIVIAIIICVIIYLLAYAFC